MKISKYPYGLEVDCLANTGYRLSSREKGRKLEFYDYQIRVKSHIKSHRVKNKTLTQRLTTKTLQIFNSLTEQVKKLKFINNS